MNELVLRGLNIREVTPLTPLSTNNSSNFSRDHAIFSFQQVFGIAASPPHFPLPPSFSPEPRPSTVKLNLIAARWRRIHSRRQALIMFLEATLYQTRPAPLMTRARVRPAQKQWFHPQAKALQCGMGKPTFKSLMTLHRLITQQISLLGNSSYHRGSGKAGFQCSRRFVVPALKVLPGRVQWLLCRNVKMHD